MGVDILLHGVTWMEPVVVTWIGELTDSNGVCALSNRARPIAFVSGHASVVAIIDWRRSNVKVMHVMKETSIPNMKNSEKNDPKPTHANASALNCNSTLSANCGSMSTHSAPNTSKLADTRPASVPLFNTSRSARSQLISVKNDEWDTYLTIHTLIYQQPHTETRTNAIKKSDLYHTLAMAHPMLSTAAHTHAYIVTTICDGLVINIYGTQ